MFVRAEDYTEIMPFHVQVVFVAVRGSDYHGDIALDDIVLKRGSCPKPLFECDFQDPNLCGFAQVSFLSGSQVDKSLPVFGVVQLAN